MKRFSLNSQLKTIKILTNDVQILILCLSYSFTTVVLKAQRYYSSGMLLSRNCLNLFAGPKGHSLLPNNSLKYFLKSLSYSYPHAFSHREQIMMSYVIYTSKKQTKLTILSKEEAQDSNFWKN